MVLTVIAVYVVSWLPYWLFQVIMLYVDSMSMPQWLKTFYQLITILSYANSMVNPSSSYHKPGVVDPVNV